MKIPVTTTGRLSIEPWAKVPLLTALVAALLILSNGALHWDEPGYLYTGVYSSFAELTAGQVQLSAIDGFMQGRILHVLQIWMVRAIVGTGPATFWVLVFIHLLLIALILSMALRMLRDLLPQVSQVGAATLLAAMTPVIMYMAGKTLAETEALAGATFATWCLWRCSRAISPVRMAGAAVAMAYVALTKNEMVFMPAGFCAAAMVVPIAGVDRRRVFIAGVGSAVAGVVLTVLALEALGVGVARYLMSYTDVFGRTPPLIAKAMNISIELGILWGLVVVAWLSARRREVLCLTLWVAFSMAPFLLFVGEIEPRHLAVNLIAIIGLFALALEVVVTRLAVWRQLSAVGRSVAATVAVVVLMGANALAIAVTPHEVEIARLRSLFDTLDTRYGAGRYTVLTAWGYTDFHIIRVLWPQVDVRDLLAERIAVSPAPGQSREQLLAEYFDGRYAGDAKAVARIGKPLVYLTFRNTFSVENLRAIGDKVAPEQVERMLGKMVFMDHRDTWLWRDSRARFEPIGRSGHYLAYEVVLNADSP